MPNAGHGDSISYQFQLEANNSSAGNDVTDIPPVNGYLDAPSIDWRVLPLWALVAAGITGNTLVCGSIVVERKLQNVTNYFLMSLAVADLFVSLVVMPCSIVQELMGYWPFGLVMCDVWQVSDVVMCTSSIMHMCTISMDRYSAIRSPLQSRTGSKSSVTFALKITSVWLVSFAIGSPLIGLGALRPDQILNELRQCAIFNSHYFIYGSLAAFFGPLSIMLVAFSLTIRLLNQQSQQCYFKGADGNGIRRCTAERRSYNKPATAKSSCKLSAADKQQQLRDGNRDPTANDGTDGLQHHNNKSGMTSNASLQDSRTFVVTSLVTNTHQQQQQGNDVSTVTAVIQTSNACDDYTDTTSIQTLSSQCYNKNDEAVGRNSFYEHKQQRHVNILQRNETNVSSLFSLSVKRRPNLLVRSISNSYSLPVAFHLQLAANNNELDRLLTDSEATGDVIVRSQGLSSTIKSRDVPRSRTYDSMLTKNDPINNQLRPQSASCRCRPEANSKQPLTVNAGHIVSSNADKQTTNVPMSATDDDECNSAANQGNDNEVKLKTLIRKHGAAFKVAGMLIANRDERQKKVFNSVKTERKAVKVLGIMFAIFCTCWTPFFIANLTMGLCQTCHIDNMLFKVFLWFGYASSTLNPIVYTIFNREFKQTFIRLLRCRCAADVAAADGRVSQLQMLVRQNPHLVNGGAMLAIRALRQRGVATNPVAGRTTT